MDWYLALWVAGALLTWGSLSRSEAGRRCSPHFFAAVVVLWPTVWAIGALGGLFLLARKLVGLVRGGTSG